MTPEERELLNRIAQTVQDNNALLRGIRRSQRWTSVLHGIYWILIIGSAVGAFWLVQPYLNSFSTFTGGASSDFSTIKNAVEAYRVQGLK